MPVESAPPAARGPRTPRPASSRPAGGPGTGAPPGWVRAVVDGAPRAAQELAVLGRAGGPAGRREGRAAAVLVCLSPGEAPAADRPRAADPRGAVGPPGDVLLLERAAGLRTHAGQPALPGGAVDPGDGGPVGAALREAREETGLATDGVHVLATMPVLRVPPEGFAVTPVLAWEPRPSPVAPGDPDEVVRVLRVPVAQLLDPRRRVRVRWDRRVPAADGVQGARQRGEGPGFEVVAASGDAASGDAASEEEDGAMLVWGFTAALLSALLDAAGLAPGWDDARVVPAPAPPRVPPGPTAAAPTAAGEVAP
ncbi:CoA pyrophosphatase [Pseudokineococcus basanitobsidens]|uniref:CoA pyrophosphatase n=1 Tax=Pseudokineococcus basanitobsidens TaxID=1926649 RepID=A0ABU8RKD8_9ACTN